MKHIFKVSKLKIQFELKKQNAEIVKYKNLHNCTDPEIF